MAPRLTTRAQEVLVAIRELTEANGRPPSREELRQTLGWKSVSTVAHFLHRLQALQLVEVEPRVARGIRITEGRPAGIPILGKIVAGGPLLSDHHLLGHVPESAARALFKAQPDFFLQVRGDSMNGAGILSGDLIAVQEADNADDADDGAIVVACLKGDTTIKTLRRDGQGRIRLEAANPACPPVPVTTPDFRIQGIVVGCVRESMSQAAP